MAINEMLIAIQLPWKQARKADNVITSKSRKTGRYTAEEQN